MGHVALRARDEAHRLTHARDVLAVVAEKAPDLDAVEAVEVLPRHRGPERPEPAEPLRAV
jgi:hypothetical protein